MFKKNIIVLVFLTVIANHTVFSQSVPTEDKMDYRNDGLILYKTVGNYNDDYTKEDRIKMGALNMVFGLGSILRGHKSGYLIGTLELLGITLIYSGSWTTRKVTEESYTDLTFTKKQKQVGWKKTPLIRIRKKR